MGAFGRSWEITKISFSTINKDKEMLLFPIFGAIFSIIFALVMLFPTIITKLLGGVSVVFGAMEYAVIFITYFGLAFIAVFFNVCVVYTAKTRFEGGNATFFESIGFAFSKIHLIFLWSLVSASVGLLLKILENIGQKSGKAGKAILAITRAILGAVWSIITIFVVPAMVYHHMGPFAAIGKSVRTLRKTWGESLIRYIGLGLAQFVFIILGAVFTIIAFFIFGALLGGAGIAATVVVAIIYFVGLFLVFGAANTVFNTALYVYADQGIVPHGFKAEIMHEAFKTR